MNETEQITAVIAEHRRVWDTFSPLCACGKWRDKRDDGTRHAAHLAAVLVAAGFGLVSEAKAEALREYAALCSEREEMMKRRIDSTADGRERNVWNLAAYELTARADRLATPTQDGCLCRDPLREVHAGCPLHGHSPERFAQPTQDGARQSCGCFACIGNQPVPGFSVLTVGMTRMIVCPECGNKRCPHGTDHRNACTGSNEPGQTGSRYGRPTPPSEDHA